MMITTARGDAPMKGSSAGQRKR